MRAKAEIESDESHDKIVVTEIPYGVNKRQLIEYISDLVKKVRLRVSLTSMTKQAVRVCVSLLM